jgi:hypothetical protein
LAVLASGAAGADVITFPVGTVVHQNAQLYQWVDRPPVVFGRLGGLSINTWNTGGLHPGGLRVQPVNHDRDALVIYAGGAAFGLERLSAVELNTTSGLRLIVVARHVASGAWFEAELPFDLNMQTYDVFDLLALDDRFGNVDQVSIDVESPFVDPVNGPYILDSLVITMRADATADFNGDGSVDFFDYDDFVAAYEAGC